MEDDDNEPDAGSPVIPIPQSTSSTAKTSSRPTQTLSTPVQSSSAPAQSSYRPYHVVGFERRFLTPPTLVFLVKSCILI